MEKKKNKKMGLPSAPDLRLGKDVALPSVPIRHSTNSQPYKHAGPPPPPSPGARHSPASLSRHRRPLPSLHLPSALPPSPAGAAHPLSLSRHCPLSSLSLRRPLPSLLRILFLVEAHVDLEDPAAGFLDEAAALAVGMLKAPLQLSGVCLRTLQLC